MTASSTVRLHIRGCRHLFCTKSLAVEHIADNAEQREEGGNDNVDGNAGQSEECVRMVLHGRPGTMRAMKNDPQARTGTAAATSSFGLWNGVGEGRL